MMTRKLLGMGISGIGLAGMLVLLNVLLNNTSSLASPPPTSNGAAIRMDDQGVILIQGGASELGTNEVSADDLETSLGGTLSNWNRQTPEAVERAINQKPLVEDQPDSLTLISIPAGE